MQIVSDVYGRLRSVVVAFPGVVHTVEAVERTVAAMYRNLMAGFPGYVGCTVLVVGNFPDMVRAVREIPTVFEDGRKLLILCVHVGAIPSFVGTAGAQRLSRWIRDAFVALDSGADHPVLLRPVESLADARANRAPYCTADFLALATGALLRPFPYRIQGGDVLACGDCAFVGRRTIEHNIPIGIVGAEREERRAAVAEDIRAALGVRTMVQVGAGRDSGEGTGTLIADIPLYHIDYYLTPGGVNARGECLLFVGRVTDASLVTGPGQAMERRALAMKDTVNAYLDAVAHRLADVRGSDGKPVFDVVRLPLILDYFRRGGLVFLSYNNCLVEIDGEHRCVYLPCYEEEDASGASLYEQVEAEVRQVFARNGFSTAMVRHNFGSRARSGGSLRCMVQGWRAVGVSSDVRR